MNIKAFAAILILGIATTLGACGGGEAPAPSGSPSPATSPSP